MLRVSRSRRRVLQHHRRRSPLALPCQSTLAGVEGKPLFEFDRTRLFRSCLVGFSTEKLRFLRENRMKTKRQGVENTTGTDEQHSKKQKLVGSSSMPPPQSGIDDAPVPVSPIDHEPGLGTASRFQAVPLVASPTYSNAVAWSDENLVAVASGHVVTILNPAELCGPKDLIRVPTAKPLTIGVVERKGL
ncbi:hypothetical protein OSB04_012171 [Centaurea solstitialis]|uniref:Uncharacterized protein n=1 Tax=Centaurea solstitialis TaxID=347529 RepID=A0AA38WDQ2_9ASTR|nr:hypothetical protein OSB04_012171 [Centaurea solstitialis]